MAFRQQFHRGQKLAAHDLNAAIGQRVLEVKGDAYIEVANLGSLVTVRLAVDRLRELFARSGRMSIGEFQWQDYGMVSASQPGWDDDRATAILEDA